MTHRSLSDNLPPAFTSTFHELLVVTVACAAQLLNQVGATQSLPMMNLLSSVFPNVTQTDKVWFLAAFPLTSGAFILISGKFGDIYGLKPVLLCGLTWASFWTIITGFSGYTSSVVFFCICRAMHGLGLAFVLPSAIGVIGSTYPNGQRKALVFSLIGAMGPLGAWLGCLFSGIVTQYGYWQWTYYANAIVFALLLVLSNFVIPTTETTTSAECVKMDWIGASVGVTGLILFNVATNQAPQEGWSSPYIVVLLVIGVSLIVSFFYIEAKVESPLIPREVMNRHTALILAVVALGWASFSVFVFYYWSFLLNLKEYTPINASLTYTTFAIFGTIAAICVAVFIRRVRPSILLIIATCGFLIGITMLANTPVHQSYFNMLLAQMILLSFGMDISFPAASLVLSDTLPKIHQGMASSLVSTMTNYAMSVSLGFAGTAEVLVLENTGDTLKSYRAAIYVGVGFAAVGVLCAVVLHLMSYNWGEKEADCGCDENDLEEKETTESEAV